MGDKETTPKSIQNDTNPDLCAINMKRRDSTSLPQVNKIEIDNATEWKLISIQDCSPPAPIHGGKSCGVKRRENTVLEWYKIYHSARTWHKAKMNCEVMDAKLITNFNSTNEHLVMIGKKLQKRFWVGATDTVNEGEYYSGQSFFSQIEIWSVKSPLLASLHISYDINHIPIS